MRRSQRHQGQATGPVHTAPRSHAAILPVLQQTIPPGDRRQERPCRCMACPHPQDVHCGTPHTAATTAAPLEVKASLPRLVQRRGPTPNTPQRAPRPERRAPLEATSGATSSPASGCAWGRQVRDPAPPGRPQVGLVARWRSGGGGGTTRGDGGGTFRPQGDPPADAAAAAPPDARTHRRQSATGEGRRRGRKKIPGVGSSKTTTPPGKKRQQAEKKEQPRHD